MMTSTRSYQYVTTAETQTTTSPDGRQHHPFQPPTQLHHATTTIVAPPFVQPHEYVPMPLSHYDDTTCSGPPPPPPPPQALAQEQQAYDKSGLASKAAPPRSARPRDSVQSIYYPPSTLKEERSNSHAQLLNQESSARGPAITAGEPYTGNQSVWTATKTFFKAFNTPNQLALLALIAFQAVCVLLMVALIYATINDAIGDLTFRDTFLQAPKLEFVATYLGVFVLAVVFEILVALDALQQKNIISIYLLTFFQLAMLVYSAVLPGQLREAIRGSSADTAFVHTHVQGYAVAIPCVVGLVMLALGFLSWRLNDEFNWALFRRVIGPEIHLKRMYLIYQIFVCFLKFDAFFFIGFSIQFLVLVTGTPTGEFAVTIAALPIICVFLLLSSLFVKNEFKPGVYLTLTVDLAGMAYFVYKLYRVYVPSELGRYEGARKSLTIFSVLSLAFLVVTFCLNALCMSNFGRGLKERIPRYAWAGRSHTLSKRRAGSQVTGKRMSIAPNGSHVVEGLPSGTVLGNAGLERSRTRMSLD